MGLAEDLKALQDLRDKGEMTDADYAHARDAVIGKQAMAPAPAALSVSKGPTSGFRLGRFIGFVLIPVAIAVVGLYAVAQYNGQAKSQQVQPQTHFIPITDGALTINALSMKYYEFAVPPGVNSVAVNGHFIASGGLGNDIIAFITDEDGFANLKNRHELQTYFNSEKVTQSAIHAVLPNAPRTYYLIFDNRFSLLAPKAVQVSATLSYMR